MRRFCLILNCPNTYLHPGRHTTRACGGNGLTISRIGNIACSKYARNIGRGGILPMPLGFDIAILHLELASKNIGIGFVANGDKHAGRINVSGFASIGIFNSHAGDTCSLPNDFIDHIVPGDINFAGSFFFLHQDDQSSFFQRAICRGDESG